MFILDDDWRTSQIPSKFYMLIYATFLAFIYIVFLAHYKHFTKNVSTYMSSWIFEKVGPEILAIFTGTTPKP